jgi:integrase
MRLCGTSYCQEYLDFVCVDEMGMLLQPDFVSQKFQKLLVKYGLRPIRFHDLRHSCATIMLYLGYTMKDIQTWLGHSNYSFTANVYVHSSKNSHIQMAQSFSENLPALGPSMSESEILV